MNKQAILIQKNGKTIKWFKVWSDIKKARVLITGKSSTGQKYTVDKEYRGIEGKPAMVMVCEAVIKYWKKYDPQKHELVCSSGHTNHVDKK